MLTKQFLRDAGFTEHHTDYFELTLDSTPDAYGKITIDASDDVFDMTIGFGSERESYCGQIISVQELLDNISRFSFHYGEREKELELKNRFDRLF